MFARFLRLANAIPSHWPFLPNEEEQMVDEERSQRAGIGAAAYILLIIFRHATDVADVMAIVAAMKGVSAHTHTER